ncbi:MAG: MAPEG family protein [Candidatus Saccharibacteria bacterium]|nr:MAPEG family protein [Moraxellaceae bacterium]
MIATPLYAGILALLYLVLSYRIIVLRGHGVSFGDGGNPVLLRRIRAHGNFSEYVPLILILIGILELSHLPSILLHVLGATLVIARLLHGYALSFKESFKFGRFWGTALTFMLLLVCGLLCIYQAVSAHAMLPLNV